MPGPPPKDQRRRRNQPARGEWKPTPGIGWQHGETPPDPMTEVSAKGMETWRIWMGSWWAAHWTPQDIPGLSLCLSLWDQTASYADNPYTLKTTSKGDDIYVLKPNPASEWRQLADNYGITYKGQQDRRWQPPQPDEKPADQPADNPYRHLRVVNE